MTIKKGDKKKVLFIMHLPPPVHGAAMAGYYIKNSTLINDTIQADYINLHTHLKVNEVNKFHFYKIFTFLVILKNVISNLIKYKYSVCYLTLTNSGPGFFKDLPIVLILKLTGNNIVYYFHNKGVADASKGWIYQLIYPLVFKNTKSILVSQFLYSDIKMYVKDEDVFFCPYGIPMNSEQKKEGLSKSGKKFKLLYLSNMMYEKGVYVLLEAIKILKAKQLEFECSFVGAWSDITEDAFNKKVEDSNLGDVAFAYGPRYGIEKFKFFSEADVFVFPTFYHYETFGLVNLEAMQHGLPIIATPEGGIPDIVINGETGFLVAQRSIKELADKIELLILNPQLSYQMGIAGRSRYDKLFTLQVFEENFMKILNTVYNQYNNS